MHRHAMPDAGATRAPRDSTLTRDHAGMVERDLAALVEEQPTALRSEVEIFDEKLAQLNDAEGGTEDARGGAVALPESKRRAWAALEAHKEMAATILAAGGTLGEAADHAGVTEATVRGYLEDEHLRARIEEQRTLIRARIGGRIEQWMERRTADPEALDAADPQTTLRIYDRVAGPAGGRGVAPPPAVTNINILTYGDLMERAARVTRRVQASERVDDAGAQGGDFPLLGAGSPAVAGGGASGD